MIDYAISELERNTEMEAAEAVRQMKEELRATKHALWMARAYNGFNTTYNLISYHNYMIEHPNTKITARRWYHCWEMVERKCREKAKEYE